MKAGVDLCGSTQDFMKAVKKTATGEMKLCYLNAKGRHDLLFCQRLDTETLYYRPAD